MSQICPIREHYGAAITHICANTNCAQNRLLCNQCIGYLHPTCGNYLLNIDAVLKKDYSLNTNWIQDKNLRDAVGTVERYKLTNDRDQVIKQTRIQIEKEYENLVAAFAQEVNVAKSKTIQRFNQSVTPITDVNFTDFTSRYKNIYNFPNFIEILNQWKKGSQNVETISKRLDTFFRDSVTNEQANQTLLAAAQRINAHSQQCTSIFTTLPFDQFKRNISMEIAKLEPEQAVQAVIAGPGQGSVNVPPSSQLWSWDAQRISSMLQLSPDCLEVTKMQKTQWKDSAVLGNLKMTGGRYQWAINVGDVSTRWICFGVIEPQYAEDLENFGFDKSCGFSLLSQRYNMVGDVTLSNYRERSYLCDLDLVNGTFRISTKTGEAGQEKDVELAKEKENLKGKAFLPYIVMYLPGNEATLRVIVGSAAAIPQPQPEADPSQQRPSMMISGQVGGGGGVPGSIMAIK